MSGKSESNFEVLYMQAAKYEAACDELSQKLNQLTLERNNYKLVAEAQMAVSGRIKKAAADLGYSEESELIELDFLIQKAELSLALAAQVEALKSAYQNLCGAINDMDDCEDNTDEMETAIGAVFHAMRNGYNSVHADPKHHLAEVKAQAGRAGFVAGYLLCNDGSPLIKHNYEGFADKYASSIRQEQYSTWLRDSNVNGGRRKGEVE